MPRASSKNTGRRRPPLRHVVAAGLVVVAVLAVVIVLVARSGGDSDGPPIPPETALGSYQVVYRVTELGQPREETVVVRRPYRSRRSSTRDGKLFSGTLVNDKGLWQFSAEPSPSWQLLDPGRRRAEADERPLGALELLAEEGLADLRSGGTVVGRPCTRFRVREPIGSIVSQPPTDRDHVDLCVDRTGVVLAERWVSGGRLVRNRRAVEFEPDPSVGSDAFTPTPQAKDGRRQPSGGRREFPFSKEIDKNLEVGFDLPDDIEADGGTAVLTLDPFGQPMGGTAYRFFRRGADVVDVEEIESEAVDTDRVITHDVPVGEGYVETDLRTVTLKVVLRGGVTVVIRGPTLELVDTMAAAMHVRDR